jgi:DNA-binding NtrC family response regulator
MGKDPDGAMTMKHHLLIVDDEEGVREAFRMALQDRYRLKFAANAKETLKALKEDRFDLCLLDIMLPDGSGLDLLRQVKRRDPAIEVIMVTALQGVETALEAMKGRAHDYITKPFRVDQLLVKIRELLERREEGQEGPDEEKGLKQWRDEAAIAPVIKKSLEKAARQGAPVWLTAPMNNGTDRVAWFLHGKSARSQGPFVVLDCASLTPQELELELFGEDRKNRAPSVGKVEFASGGTLFLAGADRLPAGTQSRLAEHFKAIPGGGTFLIASGAEEPKTRPKDAILERDFADLFVSSRVALPALSERSGEIPDLIQRYLRMSKARVKGIEKEALQALVQYPWPENLDELQKCLETMVHYAQKGTLGPEDIPLDFFLKMMEVSSTGKQSKHLLRKVNRQFERKYILRVLENSKGNQTRTAKVLGLHRNTILQKLKELNLEADYRRIVQERRKARVGYGDR